MKALNLRVYACGGEGGSSKQGALAGNGGSCSGRQAGQDVAAAGSMHGKGGLGAGTRRTRLDCSTLLFL